MCYLQHIGETVLILISLQFPAVNEDLTQQRATVSDPPWDGIQQCGLSWTFMMQSAQMNTWEKTAYCWLHIEGNYRLANRRIIHTLKGDFLWWFLSLMFMLLIIVSLCVHMEEKVLSRCIYSASWVTKSYCVFIKTSGSAKWAQYEPELPRMPMICPLSTWKETSLRIWRVHRFLYDGKSHHGPTRSLEHTHIGTCTISIIYITVLVISII